MAAGRRLTSYFWFGSILMSKSSWVATLSKRTVKGAGTGSLIIKAILAVPMATIGVLAMMLNWSPKLNFPLAVEDSKRESMANFLVLTVKVSRTLNRSLVTVNTMESTSVGVNQ